VKTTARTAKPKAKAKPKRRPPTLERVLSYYDAWLRSDDQKKVAAAMGVTVPNLIQFPKRHPEFRLAKKIADEKRGSAASFSNYVLQSLSPEAKDTWDQIDFWREGLSGQEQIREILSGKCKRVRQEIFVHALLNTSFNLSEACRLSCTPHTTLRTWQERDLEFRQMMEEIEWHKKNFFEGSLIALVEQQHPGATIHVNETINADRGYSKRLNIHHTGDGSAGGGISLEMLNLPEEMLLFIHNRMKELQEQADAMEAEAQVVEAPQLKG
tara:strand:- start:68185 stop:68991 length:807 start_codon:yes stop_codon:yes gene_type:complete